MALNFTDTTFRYEPYPIGLTRQIFSPKTYDSYVKAWPPTALFHGFAFNGGSLVHKYSLSERNNPEQYEDFVKNQPLWQLFRKYVKTARFRGDVFDMLRKHRVDLGLRGDEPELSTRFEFSMLPAIGGFLRPHTDSPGKLVTLILSILEDGQQWDQSLGGGTAMLRPKDITHNYNYLNVTYDFDAMETLHTFAFLPNQCVIFIKTFNSWHAVRPLAGADPNVFRKTLTINIESQAWQPQ